MWKNAKNDDFWYFVHIWAYFVHIWAYFAQSKSFCEANQLGTLVTITLVHICNKFKQDLTSNFWKKWKNYNFCYFNHIWAYFTRANSYCEANQLRTLMTIILVHICNKFKQDLNSNFNKMQKKCKNYDFNILTIFGHILFRQNNAVKLTYICNKFKQDFK